MKTVLYEVTDGLNIARQFSRRLIEGVQTKKNVNKNLRGCKQHQDLKVAGARYAKENKTGVKPEKLKPLKDAMDVARVAFDEKVKSLQSELVKYHELKSGELAITAQDYEDFKALFEQAKTEGKLMSFETDIDEGGEVTIKSKKLIFNNKGKSYFLKENGKVTRHSIEKADQDFPAGHLLELDAADMENVTASEKASRLSLMSQAEKDSEYLAEKENLVRWTVFKKAELELDGTSSAEANSQSVSEGQTKLDILKAEYGQA